MCWSVMIFAAGFGKRMKHLTLDRPKPMVEVAGKPLMDHARALTSGLPAKKVVANLHYKHEVLAAHLMNSEVTTLLEMPRILDTGGGLRNALPLLGRDPVMTLNSDAIWKGPNPLVQLAKAWQPDRMDALLMGIAPGRAIGTDSHGDFSPDAQGRVSRGPGLIYGGAQIIKTDLLSKIPDEVFSLNVVWDMMAAKNSLYAVEYPGFWADVGHPSGIVLAEKMLARDDV